MTVEADDRVFMESWAAELMARADRVRQLIGDAHWPSDGTHKELLVRDFLERYLPPQVVLTHGFLRPLDVQLSCSPEIDVLVANLSVESPLFAEGGLHILPPSTAIAYLQVKATFGSSAVDSALQNIRDTQATILGSVGTPKAWRGALFFHMPNSRTIESFLDTVSKCVSDSMSLMISELEDLCVPVQAENILGLLPQYMGNVDRFAAFLDAPGQDRIRIRAFELGQLSAACALADLLGAVRRSLGGRVMGHWESLIEMHAPLGPVSKELLIRET